MKKLLKSKRALSPVVAAIILIAVTVAVSIAVAAWMGALTLGFMGGTEQLQIIEVRFPTNTTVTVEVDNTGGSKITIEEVRVDGVARTVSSVSGDLEAAGTDYTLDKGKGGKFTVSFTWSAGTPYDIAVKTAKNLFGPYPANAPY